MKTKDDIYKIHAECTNCNYKSTHPAEMIEINKGVSIKDHLKRGECPICGCNTLHQQL